MKNFSSFRAHKVKLLTWKAKNRIKSAIFFFFRPLLNLSISNMHNQFEEDMWKTFQLIAPTRSNYWRKMWKIAINRPFFFFSAIIELVRELVISNMHNKFEKDMWKTFQVIAPTRSNYWRKMWKIAINRPFFFFRSLLNLSENWSLVTCITNLKRIREKLFKLSRPQGQIIDVKGEKSH